MANKTVAYALEGAATYVPSIGYASAIETAYARASNNRAHNHHNREFSNKWAGSDPGERTSLAMGEVFSARNKKIPLPLEVLRSLSEPLEW